jgi:glutamine cyclotransferase
MLTINAKCSNNRFFPWILSLIGWILFFLSCKDATTPSVKEPPKEEGYRVVNTYPHSQEAFTQGLVFYNNFIYQGTGLYGKSSIQKLELTTGTILQQRNLKSKYFGEGITIFGDSLFQLTWRSKIGFIYNVQTFDSLGKFTYSSEGWGLTHDGQRLIMSDGTSTIHFIDPKTMTFTGEITVRDQNELVTNLNELEYINGEIWANVWLTDRIVRINPGDGKVTGWLDLTGILPAGTCSQPVDVLNGIAYDSQNDRIFVTGKNWCKLFEIELITPE